jgi:hypothetical protein
MTDDDDRQRATTRDDDSVRRSNGPPASRSTDPPDLIAVALGGMAAGAGSGAALITFGITLFRNSLTNSLPIILFLGIVLAVACGWSLTRAIEDTWRRGVTGALAAFGALMLAGLAAPADLVGGPIGLIAYGTVMVVLAASGFRYARSRATT